MHAAPTHTKYQPKTLLGTMIEHLWDIAPFDSDQEAIRHLMTTYGCTETEARHAVQFGPDNGEQ